MLPTPKPPNILLHPEPICKNHNYWFDPFLRSRYKTYFCTFPGWQYRTQKWEKIPLLRDAEITALGSLALGFLAGAQNLPRWFSWQPALAGWDTQCHHGFNGRVSTTYKQVLVGSVTMYSGSQIPPILPVYNELHDPSLAFHCNWQGLEGVGSVSGPGPPRTFGWSIHLRHHFWTLFLPGYLWDRGSGLALPGLGTVSAPAGKCWLTPSELTHSSQLVQM